MRGLVYGHSLDSVEGRTMVGGTISLEPSRQDLAFWLPLILGAAPVGNLHTPVATLLPFTVLNRVGPLINNRYNDCYVSRAVFSAAEGESLKLSLDIVGRGTSELTDAAALAAINGAVAPNTTGRGRIVLFSEGTVSYSSTFLSARSFNMTIDNRLGAQFFSAAVAQCVERTNVRSTMLNINATPIHQTNNVVYKIPSGAGLLSFLSSDSREISFDFPSLAQTREHTKVEGPGVIYSPFEFEALGTQTAPEFTATLNLGA